VVERSEPRALTGLGRVALADGDLPAARRWFEAALESDPRSQHALLALAALDTRAGASEAARRSLERVLALDTAHLLAHARLAKLTGRAPAEALASISSADEALELAAAHLYDPRALLRAGELLVRDGRGDEALPPLERAVWLADRHPSSAFAALRLLSEIDEGWSRRRAIPVHLYADEMIRAQEGWRFGQRTLWQRTSATLDPVLHVRFVPVSMAAFRTRALSSQLDPIFESLRRTATPPPKRGIVAGVTGRRPPRAAGHWKLGLAEFLGRTLVVRDAPRQRRVLVHELLHLFGAVHVSERFPSIMNPDGGAMDLDGPNVGIVRATQRRGFTGRGFEADVIARVDLEEMIAAYLGALEVNLELRKLGIAEAIQAGKLSRHQQRRERREATRLDPHLGDVSRRLAWLMLADGRRVEALFLLETAVQLYGRRSVRGKATFEESEALRKALVERYEN
jgi:tetratricopeptide (TPR) repeat protein